MPDTVGRSRMWKLDSTVTGMVGAVIAQKLLRSGYRAFRKDTDPGSPFDPTDARFSWPDMLVWAAAAGVGLGIAKVVSARVARIGWEAATGALPPRAEHSRPAS